MVVELDILWLSVDSVEVDTNCLQELNQELVGILLSIACENSTFICHGSLHSLWSYIAGRFGPDFLDQSREGSCKSELS